MTRQTATPLQHTNFSATNRSAREIARLVSNGDMTINAPYQRGAIWTEDQQIALVRSWLTGVPIPAIIVNDRMTPGWRDANPRYNIVHDSSYAVVDGQQRIRAAIAWFEGDLAVPASWFPADVIEHLTDTEDGPYVLHRDLIRAERTNQAFTFMLPMAEAKLTTVKAEAEAYLLVNGGGTPQTDSDMANAQRVAKGE